MERSSYRPPADTLLWPPLPASLQGLRVVTPAWLPACAALSPNPITAPRQVLREPLQVVAADTADGSVVLKDTTEMTAVKNKKIKSKTPPPLILFPFNRVNVHITELWAVQCPGRKGLAMTPGTKDVPPQLPRNLASPCSEDVKGVYRRAGRGHLRCRRRGEGHQLPRGTRPEGSQRLGTRCPQKVAACLRNLNAIPLFVP